MSYFVTGATGFIGRHLVERLLQREGDIHVLVREGSRERLDELIERWGAGDRIKPVVGDLREPLLGVSEEDRKALAGVEHFFHLAAIYDMAADETRNAMLNVGGTQNAVDLANAVSAEVFHHVSSVAVAGQVHGWQPAAARSTSEAIARGVVFMVIVSGVAGRETLGSAATRERRREPTSTPLTAGV